MNMEIITQATASPEVDLDPWLLAKDRYLANLDDDERALFDKATIENIYYKTSNEARDERKSKTSSAIRKLQPLVAALNDYGEALNVCTNISPLPLAPIWGSIRILLVLAEKYDKYYVRIVDFLGRIGDLLPRLHEYGKVFDLQRHRRLRQALSEIYFDIITLCLKFHKILQCRKKVSLKRISRPLLQNVHYEDALEQFRRHKKNVEKEVGTCHMIEAAEIRDLALRNQEVQELREKTARRKTLLSRLSSIDYKSRHEYLRNIRHGNTGAWLKTELAYRAWLEHDGVSMLCCYGIPGCGKSVLTSSIVDALTDSKSCLVTYYFCDYADKRTLDPAAILGTITGQLLNYTELIPLAIEQLIEKNLGDDKCPDLNVLHDIFRAAIQLFPAVTIVLDGIDEIDESGQKIFYTALNKLIQDAGNRLKLLISCRDDATNILRTPPETSFRVHLQPSNIGLDIEEYIHHSVESLLANREIVLRDSLLKEVMIEKLVEGAQGMFLWVKFQLDDLCNAESDAGIKRVLNNLPKDLSETYARLLGRITGTQRQALAKRMFQWIICARRPLHVDELREGIAFTIDDEFFDREKLPTDMPRLVRGCGNLVIIDEDTENVHLAHYTVQQYILLEEATCGNPCQSYRFTRNEANNMIGETCIAYLSFSDFETQMSKAINRSFVEMALLQKATATGTSANIGALSNTVRHALALVHKGSAPSNVGSLKIDYQRVLPKRGIPPQILSDSYQLLSYAAENWLSHTAAFGTMSKRTSSLLRALIFEKERPFTFRPWISSEDTGISNLLRLIGWGLENDHMTVLKTIPDSLPDGLGETFFRHFENICDFAKRSNRKDHVSSAFMNTLEDSNNIKSFSGQANAQLTWVYSKLVIACRHGNLNVIRNSFRYEVSALRTWNEGTTFAFNHMLFEAVAYGQLELVKWIIDADSEYRVLRRRFTYGYSSGEHLDCDCTVLDVALLRGYPKIATLLIQASFNLLAIFDILSKRMEDVLKNTAAVDTILEVLTSISSNQHQRQTLHLLHYLAISQTALQGDLVRMSRLIRNFAVEELVEPGSRPLSRAMSEKNPALVRLLIEAGADDKYFVYRFQTLLPITEDPGLWAPRPSISDRKFLDALLEEMIPNATQGSATFRAISHVLISGSAEAYKCLNTIAQRVAIERIKESESRSNQFDRYTCVVDPYLGRITPVMTILSEAYQVLIKVHIAAECFETEDLDRAVWFAICENNIYGLHTLIELGVDLRTWGPSRLSTLEYAIKDKQLEIFFLLIQMSSPGHEISCSDFWLEVAEQQWPSERIKQYSAKVKVYQSDTKGPSKCNGSQKSITKAPLAPI